MAKLTPPSVRRFRSYLAQHGFEKRPKRGKGDHELWVHKDDPARFLILDPGQDPPKLGTFKAMLRQAQLGEQDFR